MKSVVLVAAMLAMICSASAEIVFDGSKSYSSYSGRGFFMPSIHLKAAEDSVILQDYDTRQIDYTVSNPSENRSMISDPQGMIIEAEGYHRLRGRRMDFSYGGIKPCAETNGFRLSHTAYGLFEYRVDVRTPGIYTFAIDIEKCLYNFNVSLYGREENEDPASDGKLIGQWVGNSNPEVGGSGRGTPFPVDVELEARIKWLVLVVGRGSSDIDRLRVTGFRPNSFKPELTPEASAQEGGTADSRRIILFSIAGVIALVVAVLFVLESKRRRLLRQKNLKETAGSGKKSEW